MKVPEEENQITPRKTLPRIRYIYPILRASKPHWFVTHNGVFGAIDYRGRFTCDLDFLSYDSYPFFEHDPCSRAAGHAFNLEHVRAYSGNFVVLEHQSGAGGQAGYYHNKPEPGEMPRLAWASIARGAAGLLFFRERSCRFGAEEYWEGIIDHDNVPRRRYHEAAQLGAELTRMCAMLTSTVGVGKAAKRFRSEERSFISIVVTATTAIKLVGWRGIAT